MQPAIVGRARQTLATLTALGIEPIDDVDDPLLLAELRATSGLRMPDSCVLAAAIRESAAIATFDARLAEAAPSVGVRVLAV